MIYGYGARVDNDSNAITVVDEENRTEETKGYINGEYVEFSGGGSSDFSTAQVSVVNNSSGEADINILSSYGDCSADWELSPNTLPVCVFGTYLTVPSNSTDSVPIVVYKGHSLFGVSGAKITTSGNVELIDADNHIYDVSGDCTITITDLE